MACPEGKEKGTSLILRHRTESEYRIVSAWLLELGKRDVSLHGSGIAAVRHGRRRGGAITRIIRERGSCDAMGGRERDALARDRLTGPDLRFGLRSGNPAAWLTRRVTIR